MRGAGKLLLGLHCFVSDVPQRARNTVTAVVPQVTPDFPNDHRYSICGKLDTYTGIKVVNGFHKSNTANLEQIVHVFIVIMEPFDDRQNKAEISFDIAVPGIGVSLFDFIEKCFFFFFFEYW